MTLYVTQVAEEVAQRLPVPVTVTQTAFEAANKLPLLGTITQVAIEVAINLTPLPVGAPLLLINCCM